VKYLIVSSIAISFLYIQTCVTPFGLFQISCHK